MKTIKNIALVLFFSISMITSSAIAATLNVAKWGTDSATCGSSSIPCLTIQQAVNNSSIRGKIIVFPGVYQENVAISTEGIQLTSIAGRYGTIIEAASSSSHVLSITTRKVVIGKKGKGFTFTGATGSLQAGISTGNDCDNCKIEGNLATGNYYGFDVDGSKIQVRNNISENNTRDGFVVFGLNFFSNTFYLLQGNTAQNNGANGFEINSNGTSFFNNIAKNNGSLGMDFGVFSYLIKVKDNVSSNNTGGFYIDDMDGSLLQSNIAARNGADGFNLDQDPASVFKKPSVVNNLAVASGTQGFEIDNFINVKFDSNSAIHNGSTGIYLDSGTTLSSFKNNNTYAAGNGAGIHNNSGNLITRSKHFFGSKAGVPDATFDSDGHDAISGPNHAGTNSTKEHKFKAKKASAL